MPSSNDAWLGVPDGKLTGAVDAYTSRLGGRPSWLREVDDTCLGNQVTCPQCGGALALVTQLHAPLSYFDRILYVHVCLACCGKGKPAVRVHRSQVYNAGYDDEWRARVEAAKPKQALFEEADDWGDEDEDEAPAAAPSPAPAEPAVAANRYEWTPKLAAAAKPPTGKPPLPAWYLDTVMEPRGPKVPTESDETALGQIEQRAPGTFENDPTADDATDDEDTTAEDYVERLSREQRQCIRWQPGGQPLVARRDAPVGPSPPCSKCGAARQFEFQVVSPAVYFLSGDRSEDEQPLHFSTILIFTCAAHCYTEADPLVEEFAIWHDEL